MNMDYREYNSTSEILDSEKTDNTTVQSLSTVNMNMDYREYDSKGKILDSEKTDYVDMSGLNYDIGYILNKKSSYDKISFSLQYLGGRSDYKGSLLGSNTGYGSYKSWTINTLIDTKFAYSRAYIIGKSFEISGGIGLGYRYWDRVLSKKQSEVYKWFSLRPNIGVNYNINRNFFLKTSLEYQYGIDPVMIDVKPDQEFLLGSANILQENIALSYHIANTLNVSLQYTYEVQEIGASNIVNGMYEPDSTAKNRYIKIEISKSF
jgi:hypothetical protein